MNKVVQVIIKGIDLFTGPFKNADKSIQSLARLSKNVARDLAAAGTAAAGFVLGLTKMAQRGAEVIDVQQAFNRMTGDGASAIKLLRAQTEGLVSDYELMVGANKALANGTARTVEEFGELAKIAKAISGPTGLGEAEAIEAIAEAIARVSDRSLAQLGITIDLKQANEEYAATLGKQATQLTEVETREALRQAVFKEGIKLTKEFDSAQSSAAENADRFAAAIANFRDNLSRLVSESPRVAAFFETLSFGLASLAGRNVASEAEISSLSNVSDPDVLRLRRGDVQARGLDALARLAREQRRPAMAGGSPQTVKRLREELEGLAAVLNFIDSRLNSLGQSAPGAAGAAGAASFGAPSGFAAGLFGPGAFHGARFGLAAGATGPSPFAAGLMSRLPARALPMAFRPGRIRMSPIAVDPAQAATDFSEAGAIAVASFGSMAEAAIRGSELTADSVIGMIARIAQSIPGVGGLAGAAIGAGAGILGALFGRRRDDPVPIRLAAVDDGAARKLAEARGGPERITVQIISPMSGEVLSEVETRLRRNEARDAIRRIPRGTTLGG